MTSDREKELLTEIDRLNKELEDAYDFIKTLADQYEALEKKITKA